MYITISVSFVKGLVLMQTRLWNPLMKEQMTYFLIFLVVFLWIQAWKEILRKFLSETFKNMQQELFSDVPFYKKELQKCENEFETNY